MLHDGGLIPCPRRRFRQRVGLAQALIHDPQVLILDEPTTGLDPNQLADIRKLIQDIGREKTVMLSTHIMQEVEAICDRVIIIDHGRIKADNRLEKIKEVDRQIIEVEFDKAVAQHIIDTIPNLYASHRISDANWELTFSTPADMRPAVFDFAQQNGLKTLQLAHKNKNLETVFREMTNKK